MPNIYAILEMCFSSISMIRSDGFSPNFANSASYLGGKDKPIKFWG